jgi:catechol 2,3-dioxygenase-like lactoylglutathione lyase family enzyme
MSILTNAPPIAYVLTRDRARAKTFYAETLGLPIKGENFFATIFDLNGTELYLTTVADWVPHTHPVLGWTVSDIAAALKALKDKGVPGIIYPDFGQDELGAWTAPDGKKKLAWVKDPDGNVLGLTQY